MIAKVTSINLNKNQYNNKNNISFGTVTVQTVVPAPIRMVSNIDIYNHPVIQSTEIGNRIIEKLTKDVADGMYSHFKFKKPGYSKKPKYEYRNTYKGPNGWSITVNDRGSAGEEIEVKSRRISEENLPNVYKQSGESVQDTITIVRDSDNAKYYDAFKAVLDKIKIAAQIRDLNKLVIDVQLKKFKFIEEVPSKVDDKIVDAKYIFKSRHGRQIIVSNDKKKIELVSRKGSSTAFIKSGMDLSVKSSFDLLIEELEKSKKSDIQA